MDVDGADQPSRRAKKGHTTNASAIGRRWQCVFVVLQARARGHIQLPCVGVVFSKMAILEWCLPSSGWCLLLAVLV
jgi:hypothetical protein